MAGCDSGAKQMNGYRFDSSVAGPQQFMIASPNPIPAPKKKGI